MKADTLGLNRFIDKLGRHHFAYLRAAAEGIPVPDAARRYLGIDHEAAAPGAHRLVVDRVRAVLRRKGDSRWRLVGLDIRENQQAVVAPSLSEWAEGEGLDGWSEAELQEMYAERFGNGDPEQRRRARRNARLRERRMEVLRELETSDATRATAGDLIEGWVPLGLARQLKVSGVLTLGDLQHRIAAGRQWWRGLHAFGPIKARRLAQHVQALMAWSDQRAGVRVLAATAWPVAAATERLRELSGQHGANRLPKGTAGAMALSADDDRAAVRAWIGARAGSVLTAKMYEREVERFMLWCVLERNKALSDAGAEDCRAYMDFLANVPDGWMSRRKVERLKPGWAPFRGQLTRESQAVAISALHSACAWLVEAQYLVVNPWMLVNRKLGDAPAELESGEEFIGDVGSRAFSPAAWGALFAELDEADCRDAKDASSARLRWLCSFLEGTGLRSQELLKSQRGHLVNSREGWTLAVSGKGSRNRSVPVPSGVVAATRRYFGARGLDFDKAPRETPLLGSLVDPTKAISYRALYETFTRFVRRAIEKSRTLTGDERRHAMLASTHWLRHTHGTRSAERGVDSDVLQANLGQADPRTTARYYRAQIHRRQQQMERAFGNAPGGAATAVVATDTKR